MLCIIHIRIVPVIGVVLTVECSSVVYVQYISAYVILSVVLSVEGFIPSDSV